MAVKIQLANGRGVAVIDDADKALADNKYMLHSGRACRWLKGGAFVYLHRDVFARVLRRPLRDEDRVSFKDGDLLNCRRDNLFAKRIYDLKVVRGVQVAKIRRMRKIADLNFISAAEKAGWGRGGCSLWQQIEAGKLRTPHLMSDVARVLKVGVEEIFTPKKRKAG